MTIMDIAQTDVVTADRDAGVTELVSLMRDEDVGSVVVTEDDEPVGVVTDRMVALALADSGDVSEMNAGELVSGEDLVTVSPDDAVFDVIRTLDDAAVRRVPVVEDDALRGIVSLDDVVVLLAEELSNVGSVIRQQSPRF